MLTTGDLTESITIQAPTFAADGRGGFNTSWTDIATVWAKAWTVSSVEGVAGMQTSLKRIQKFGIRFRRVMKSGWRVKWKNQYFNITGIDPENYEWMYLTCEGVE
ncbi:MAG: phage head closure protein [Sphaerochaeta sp.]|jgi:SPP1 family predicted phage head-tail adaptor|nr:phage head closure protein [Sphaerochaeta sp.]MDD5049975.1 phage head closure protein [Methanoregulaceae archaeon]